MKIKPTDESKFASLLERANNGDLEAKFEVARFYTLGKGVECNLDEAQKWLADYRQELVRAFEDGEMLQLTAMQKDLKAQVIKKKIIKKLKKQK